MRCLSVCSDVFWVLVRNKQPDPQILSNEMPFPYLSRSVSSTSHSLHWQLEGSYVLGMIGLMGLGCCWKDGGKWERRKMI